MSVALTRGSRRAMQGARALTLGDREHETLMLRILSERAAHEEADQPVGTLDRAIMKGWIYVSGLARAVRRED